MNEPLHTKYRPQILDEVIGQDDVVASLKKSTRNHTYLFVGPPGTGKTTLARILANQFAGGKAGPTNVEEINAADSSGADDIRAVVGHTHYRAIGHSPVKSIILDEAHRLSAAAWTVLLKPTEEPPSHVYWLFCTTELGKVPKNIQTRCLRFDLKPVDELVLFDLVDKVSSLEKIDITQEVLEAIAENSGGSPRQALVNLEAVQFCESAAEARRVMRSASQSREVSDLCRWLVSGKNHTWAEAAKFVKALEGTEAESIRINVVLYLSQVLLGTKDNNRAAALLHMLDCFSTSFNQSDKLAPLLLALGMALRLDQ